MSDVNKYSLDDTILQVAKLMELAARTAPKTKGEDFIRVQILQGEEIQRLSRAMIQFGAERKKGNFDRDGANVAASGAVVLIGIKDALAAGLNCGACGFASCAELKAAKPVDDEFKGPICAYRHLDMGIALGSAAKTAQMFNVDNRIMYRIGAAARWLGLIDWDYAMGIPLSAGGKNIYFDR
jgi:uncharacterized ferredoxin-like protein